MIPWCLIRPACCIIFRIGVHITAIWSKTFARAFDSTARGAGDLLPKKIVIVFAFLWRTNLKRTTCTSDTSDKKKSLYFGGNETDGRVHTPSFLLKSVPQILYTCAPKSLHFAKLFVSFNQSQRKQTPFTH